MKHHNLRPAVLLFLFLVVLQWSCSDNEQIVSPEESKPSQNAKEIPLTEANQKNSEPSNGRIEATSCGTSVSGNYYSTGYYTYPDRPLDLSNVATGATVTIYCDAYEVPNRINVYRAGSYVASSGWIGYSSTPGPWGSTLNGPGTKTFTFVKGSTNDYVIRTETMTSNISDAWYASISCPVVPVCCVTSGGSNSGTYTGSGYYTYTDRAISFCSTSTGRTGYVNCTANETPNRFVLYNNGTYVASTGWMGYSSTPGPWGSTLNAPSTQLLTFTIGSNTNYQLRVETMTSSQSDSWSASAGCQN